MEERQADWIAKTFGLDVHLFGITNEDARQYNAFFYPETYAHVDSEAIISLLHLFLKQNPLVGHARGLWRTQMAAGDRTGIAMLLPTGSPVSWMDAVR